MNTAPLYAVFGNPIAHSRSPAIHAQFAEQTGIELRYETRLAPLGDFTGALAAFRAEGGVGCNVTVPFKFDAAAACVRLAPRAARAGAANTLGWDAQGQLWGDNSDGTGLTRDLARLLGRAADTALRGSDVLLLGAGGAAAGVLGSLLEAGPRAITVWNRSAARAQALVASHAGLAAQCGVLLQASAIPHAAADVVINATSASLGGHPLELAAGLLHPGVLAYDMVYAARPTAFVVSAAAAGAQAADGLGMLVEQAAESFFLWHGVRPRTAPVLAAMRARLDAEAAAR